MCLLTIAPCGPRDDYFKENEVLEQIDKDVRRLSPEFSFYQQPTGRPRRMCSYDA